MDSLVSSGYKLSVEGVHPHVYRLCLLCCIPSVFLALVFRGTSVLYFRCRVMCRLRLVVMRSECYMPFLDMPWLGLCGSVLSFFVEAPLIADC